jgi:mannose-6-phosphate isomerase-like protein (cupin superfamily)
MSAPNQFTRLLADEGQAVRARGDLYIFKVRAAQTDGQYSLFEAWTAHGGGVPLHYHTLDEESFYVVEGSYEFQVGDDILKASRGECLHVPRPLPHAFRDTGEQPGKLLIVISPGGYHEAYFEEAWEAITDLRNVPPNPAAPDFQKIGAAMQKAGLHLVAAAGSGT